MFRLSRDVFETVLAETWPYLTDSNSRNSEQNISACFNLELRFIIWLTAGMPFILKLHQLQATAKEGGRVARAAQRVLVPALAMRRRLRRHTRGQHGALAPPAPAGEGGRVVRAAQRALVPPRA